MRIIKPSWLTHGGKSGDPSLEYLGSALLTIGSTGEKKDFEVYSCNVSPDGERLVTAAGGTLQAVATTIRVN